MHFDQLSCLNFTFLASGVAEAWIASDLGGYEYVMLRMRSDALRNMKSLDKAIKREEMMGITRIPENEDKMEKEGKELSEHTKTRNMSRAGVEEQIRGPLESGHGEGDRGERESNLVGRRDDNIKATEGKGGIEDHAMKEDIADKPMKMNGEVYIKRPPKWNKYNDNLIMGKHYMDGPNKPAKKGNRRRESLEGKKKGMLKEIDEETEKKRVRHGNQGD